MKPSTALTCANAAFRLAMSSCSGSLSLTAIGPTQTARRATFSPVIRA